MSRPDMRVIKSGALDTLEDRRIQMFLDEEREQLDLSHMICPTCRSINTYDNGDGTRSCVECVQSYDDIGEKMYIESVPLYELTLSPGSSQQVLPKVSFKGITWTFHRRDPQDNLVYRLLL